jgi:L-seryl-tRNA(Ser) seleniumtransferase
MPQVARPPAGVLKYHAHMASASDPATDWRASMLRRIPSVDELAGLPRLTDLATRAGRPIVMDAARTVLGRLRQSIVEGAHRQDATAAAGLDALGEEVAAEVARSLAPSLRQVINATGVILHTNLGRAPLAAEAIEHVRQTAGSYTNLEYDLEKGTRGKRDTHTARLLARLIGAEAAVVVNNNAAAIFLVLAALARGGEVVVSRGELIEIGESFRIPDIMAESGAVLREVGTTNRTSIQDYEHALNDRTRLLLRVHQSNFRIVGFTSRPSLGELVELGRRRGVLVYEDLGSGCLIDLSASGVAEPVVRASIGAGVDMVSFSGDKLLGGPQAGIIAGRSAVVERVRKHPLFRALRVDKLVIAALEATLMAYVAGGAETLPVLRMIGMPAAEIERRARGVLEILRREMPAEEVELELAPGMSVIGGGSTPEEFLTTTLLQISTRQWSAGQIEERLRKPAKGPAVLARIAEKRLELDLRTVFPEQEVELIAAIVAACAPC